MTFNERVKTILALENVSQREFAKLINISESQLSKLLNGKKRPTYRELSTIIEVLDIPYDCLMGKVPLFDKLIKCVATSQGVTPIWSK